MLDELISQLLELYNDMEIAMEYQKELEEVPDDDAGEAIKNALEFQKLRAKIETTFAQLAILFVKLPALNKTFDDLRTIYKYNFLYKPEQNNQDVEE